MAYYNPYIKGKYYTKQPGFWSLLRSNTETVSSKKTGRFSKKSPKGWQKMVEWESQKWDCSILSY